MYGKKNNLSGLKMYFYGFGRQRVKVRHTFTVIRLFSILKSITNFEPFEIV